MPSLSNKRKRWYRIFHLRHIWMKMLLISVACLLLLLSSLGYYYYTRALDYDIELLRSMAGDNVLYDKDKHPLGTLNGREFIRLEREDIPQQMIDAIVAREDNDFFTHGGIDYSALMRSLMENVVSMRYKQGGSTISMQLARNLYELRAKNLDRKFLEIAITCRLESHYDKDTLITQYLNIIYFGQHCYGLGNAARHYFDKEVKDLNLVECATLAGLVRGPGIFNPVASMESAMRVKAETLKLMLHLEMIEQAEYDEALKAPIVLRLKKKSQNAPNYPLMQAREEFSALQESESLKYETPSMAAVSSYSYPIQRYLEQEAEAALVFIEGKGDIPKLWKEQALGAAPTEAEEKAFQKQLDEEKRPRSLPVRSPDNQENVLQCLALVVNSKAPQRGEILALLSGRSSFDGMMRWQDESRLGSLASPFIFAAASCPEKEGAHIIVSEPEKTAEKLEEQYLRDYFSTLQLTDSLPEDAQKLYRGDFPVNRWKLAEALYCFLNQGKKFPFHSLMALYSQKRDLLYLYRPAAPVEYILRESAYTASRLPPFKYEEGVSNSLHVTLPDDEGQWSMVHRPNSVTVFLWVGFDMPRPAVAGDEQLKKLLAKYVPKLADSILDFAHQQLNPKKETAS